MADRDALVEHETFAGKAALGLGHGFEILQNPALEVKHLFKALGQEIGRGLFAANAAGAEHRHFLVAGRVEMGFDIVLEFGEGLGRRIERALKRTQPHFIIITGVEQHHIVALDQPVPVLGLDIGAHRLGRIGLGRAQCHDLGLEPHLHAQERHGAGGRIFDFGPGQPSGKIFALEQIGGQSVDRFWRARHRTIDPFRCQDQRALDVLPATQLRQRGLQRLAIGQIGEFIDRHYLVWLMAMGQIGHGYGVGRAHGLAL